jgi:predicted amidohydrolase YtcJ
MFKKTILLLAVGLFFLSCGRNPEKADLILTGGIIHTMDSAGSTTEAIAVKSGRIMAAGTEKEILTFKGDSTRVIRLAGKTVLPGFVDPHSHFISAVISVISTNISSPPIDSVRKISDIIEKLKQLKASLNLNNGEVLLGMGLDPDQLKEKRYPMTADLDPAFPDNPVVLVHASGHIGVYNSMALKLAGIDDKTADPMGGIIGRFPGSSKPNGVVYENAWFGTQTRVTAPQMEKLAEKIKTEREEELKSEKKPGLLPADVETRFKGLLLAGQEKYASEGYTTIQEGASSKGVIGFLKLAAREKLLYLDVVSLVSEDQVDALVGNPDFIFGRYSDGLTFRGVKFICDGSPQGKTAYLSKPLLPASGCLHDCSGKPNIDPSTLEKGMKKMLRFGSPGICSLQRGRSHTDDHRLP